MRAAWPSGLSRKKMKSRRKAYRKKRGTSGAYGTYANKVLSSLYNPFTTKNNQPKWPDGKCQYSIGRKHQHASELHGEEMVIALFPGVVNWCLAIQSNTVTNATLDTVTNIFRANHTSKLSVAYNYTKATKSTPNTEFHQWYINTPTVFTSWRPVSYALHIRCINNDESNEGWFECIRTGRQPFTTEMGLTTTKDEEGSILFYPASIVPSNTAIATWMATRNWSLSPTYATGKIKDLGAYVFQLNNQKTDNDFLPLQTIYAEVNGTDAISPESSGTLAVVTKDTDDNNVVGAVIKQNDTATLGFTPGNVDHYWKDTVYSDALDMILIRIHGVANTKLLLHSVANMEFLMPEGSEYAQYMSAAYSAKPQLNRFLAHRNKYNKMAFQTVGSLYRNYENIK